LNRALNGENRALNGENRALNGENRAFKHFKPLNCGHKTTPTA